MQGCHLPGKHGKPRSWEISFFPNMARALSGNLVLNFKVREKSLNFEISQSTIVNDIYFLDFQEIGITFCEKHPWAPKLDTNNSQGKAVFSRGT